MSTRKSDGRVEGLPTAESTALASADDQDLRVACFCEENCWRLLYRHLHGAGDDSPTRWEYFAVFISNRRRQCPMFRQRASADPSRDGYVCWDYHVVVLRRPRVGGGGAGKTEVLDVDTRIGYPASLESYLDGSFPHASSPDLDASYLPSFRAVPARDYLTRFYSDRGHMIGGDGWLAEPPGHGCIMAGAAAGEERCHEGGNVSNLDSYIDMTPDGGGGKPGKGKVYTLERLRKEFIG